MASKYRSEDSKTNWRSMHFLTYVEVLDFPDQGAPHYAQVRADLKNRGRMIGANESRALLAALQVAPS